MRYRYRIHLYKLIFLSNKLSYTARRLNIHIYNIWGSMDASFFNIQYTYDKNILQSPSLRLTLHVSFPSVQL